MKIKLIYTTLILVKKIYTTLIERDRIKKKLKSRTIFQPINKKNQIETNISQS